MVFLSKKGEILEVKLKLTMLDTVSEQLLSFYDHLERWIQFIPQRPYCYPTAPPYYDLHHSIHHSPCWNPQNYEIWLVIF